MYVELTKLENPISLWNNKTASAGDNLTATKGLHKFKRYIFHLSKFLYFLISFYIFFWNIEIGIRWLWLYLQCVENITYRLVELYVCIKCYSKKVWTRRRQLLTIFQQWKWNEPNFFTIFKSLIFPPCLPNSLEHCLEIFLFILQKWGEK